MNAYIEKTILNYLCFFFFSFLTCPTVKRMAFLKLEMIND